MSRTRRRHLAVAGALTALLGACAGASSEGPPEIRWGVDECSRCHMIVSEERYAAAARHQDGEVAVFDDVGELALWLGARQTAGWRAWARTENGWVDASRARYVRSPAAVTPMGSGVVAWADSELAESAAAAARGEVLGWEELPRAAGMTALMAAEDGPSEDLPFPRPAP